MRTAARLLAATLVACVVATFGTAPPAALAAGQFTNPVMDNQTNPWVTHHNGYYYAVTSVPGGASHIWIRKSATLDGLGGAAAVSVFAAPAGDHCCVIWAPELHRIGNRWYIYYTAGSNNTTHRLFVLEATTTGDDPQAVTYADRGRILTGTGNVEDIDPTTFVAPDGDRYLLWAGTVDWGLELIYIAKMSDPVTLVLPASVIVRPTLSWERSQGWIVEAPQVLVHNGTVDVVYSAPGVGPLYSLGVAKNTDGDYTTESSWTKSATPVFAPDADVSGPGHNGFFVSPDGTEDWIVYHARNVPYDANPWTVRAQRFYWNADDTPNLGYPLSTDYTIDAPSGEPGTGRPRGWQTARAWQVGSATAATSTGFGASWAVAAPEGPARGGDYTVSATARWIANGTTDPVPIYGLRALWQDSANWVGVFLDPTNRRLSTVAKVGGVTSAWETTPLEGSFVFGSPHTLTVQKQGTTYRFHLDGSATPLQTRTFALSRGRPALATYDAQAAFTDVTVTS